MPNIENQTKFFSLLEVMSSIQKTIIGRYSSLFWVKAEMIKLNHYTHSGHCYPDLVEKKEGRIVAQTRAIIWKNDFESISKKFIYFTKEPIKDGVTILFQCRINFDTLHGLSLNIIDIDPMFTLGELEKERQETIERLKKEDLFHANSTLPLALLPQRLAIISVQTSKGYSDFMNIIDQEKNYKLFTYLFPSLLQGDNAVETLIQALEAVEKVKKHFDAVLIIRGGGGDIGLSCYNNYELSKTIANFPLPVLTGIGHSTNETVAEMVAYKNAITPTELADFILNRFRAFDQEIEDIKKRLVNLSKKRIEIEGNNLQRLLIQIKQSSKNRLITEENQLKALEKYITLLNPNNLLKRGYTITLKDNRIIKSKQELKQGDKITTQFQDGTIESTI
ncbi:MAG: xseA [Bacteroidetes bacterium]|nr:xseA [Bacteroidota bacterium]